MATYAGRAQTRFAQQQAAGLNGDRHWKAGTAVFGQQKAEEESRLINDSTPLRTGQVCASIAPSAVGLCRACRLTPRLPFFPQLALAFAGAFAIAFALRGDKDKETKTRR
jgi:hypothetical protein